MNLFQNLTCSLRLLRHFAPRNERYYYLVCLTPARIR